jgi:cytochrome c oxidase cbb3-type subunit IV
MDIYTFLRELADSWVLVALFSFFGAAVLWAFRPGSRDVHRDTSNIPFRHEDRPASEPAPASKEVS